MARALRLLMRREHSRAELAKKLAPHAESDEAVEQLLDDLVARTRAELAERGSVTLDLEGERFECTADEIAVQVVAKPGYAAAGGRAGVVVLHTGPLTREQRLIAAVLLMGLGGCGMYSVTVVLPRIQAEFGVARADASLPYTLTGLPGNTPWKALPPCNRAGPAPR